MALRHVRPLEPAVVPCALHLWQRGVVSPPFCTTGYPQDNPSGKEASFLVRHIDHAEAEVVEAQTDNVAIAEE